MYLVSLHGHGTSCSPSASGLPTECTAGTKKPSSPISSRAALPIRVMIFIETTTYAESVISTPSAEILDPSGPMQNGTTYIVRPFMHPSNSPLRVSRISLCSTQLLVGPALASFSLQMKFRLSTRATSFGSERARKLLGCFSAFRRVRVPDSTSSLVSRSHSSSDPSHHTTRSGVVSSATSRTQAMSFLCRVGALSRPGTVLAVVLGLLVRSSNSAYGAEAIRRSLRCLA